MASVVFGLMIGIVVGVWFAVSFHRRNPNYRDAPSFRRTLWASGQALWSIAIMVLGLGVFALLAWALGELNGSYLAFAGTFFAVQIIAAFVWPILRGRHRRRVSA